MDQNMKEMNAQIKHETLLKNIGIKLTKQKSKQEALTTEINEIQNALQDLDKSLYQKNQEDGEDQEEKKYLKSMIDQYKLFQNSKVDCKTIGDYHMQLMLKVIKDEQLNKMKGILMKWAELRKNLIQCNLKITNQQTQLQQLEKLIPKPSQEIQLCSSQKKLNKVMSAQRLIKQFTSQFNQEDINQEVHQQLLYSQIYPEDDMEFWTNLNLILKSYLLTLEQDSKQISQIEQIQSRLAIAVNCNEQLQQQQQQQEIPYNFPLHRPDYFMVYTQVDYNAVCQGFHIGEELYIFDQYNGCNNILILGCDYNGCYYDKNSNPDGWYRIKKNNMVVRYLQDKKEDFEVELRELKWLDMQTNAKRQGIRKYQEKAYFRQKFNEKDKLSEWRLIKETLQLETMGISIGK